MAQNLTPTQTGAELLVNTVTLNDQNMPSVASLAGGGYVVTWTSLSQDGSGEGVYAQRFSAAGAKLGGEFHVSTATLNSQFQSKAAGLADGGFVITWASYLQDGSGEGVFAQRYNADGTAAGSEFQVNTTTLRDQMHPSVTALADGFVVTWASLQQDSKWDLFAQRYDANGAAAGGEFRVNTTTTNDQYQATVTALTGGGFVVTWTSVGQDGDQGGIYAQRYSAAGTAVGGEFRITTTTAGNQDQPAVAALADGGFAVAWASAGQDGSGEGVYARRYSSSGTAAGGEIHVGTTTAGDQQHPAIAATADGGFLVSWTSTGQDGSGDGIYGQRFDAVGGAVGSEFRVNTATAGNQADPAAALLTNGTVVLAWDSAGQDGSGAGVYAQAFAMPAAGAAPVGAAHLDLSGDGRADILWRGAGGEIAVWQMNDTQITKAAVLPQNPGLGWTIAGTGDFNADSKADILLRGAGGEVAVWQMNGTQLGSAALVAANPGTGWTIAGTGDFDGDGRADILWRGAGGEVATWQMNGAQIVGGAMLPNPGLAWTVAGTGDFNGDGRADILWRGAGGEVAVWQMNGTQVASAAVVANPGSTWSIAGTGDFNGDGHADILWRGQGGAVAIWEMNGTQLVSGSLLANPGNAWTVAAVADFNGDGRADILWRDTAGHVATWDMDGARIVTATLFDANPGTSWHAIG